MFSACQFEVEYNVRTLVISFVAICHCAALCLYDILVGLAMAIVMEKSKRYWTVLKMLLGNNLICCCYFVLLFCIEILF